jgi:hypothetical protein
MRLADAVCGRVRTGMEDRNHGQADHKPRPASRAARPATRK